MGAGSTLLQLRADNHGVFDGSTRGVAVVRTRNARLLPVEGGVFLENGAVQLARHAALDALQTFTIEATIAPEKVTDDRHNILEAQSPAVALFIDASGRLVGSVHTAAGWVSVDSGSIALQASARVRVRFTRAEDGQMSLAIAGQTVGTRMVPGPIQSVGPAGFTLGAWIDAARWPFVGRVTDVVIRQGVLPDRVIADKQALATRIAQRFRETTGLSRVIVNLLPDVSHSRLQPIKDIMNAAGVERLSDLSTLRVTAPMQMVPGRIVVAPRRSTSTIDWSQVASQFVGAATATARRDTLARFLTNRNSKAVLTRMPTAPITPSTPITPMTPPTLLGPAILAPTTPVRPPTLTPIRPGGVVAPVPVRRTVAPLAEGGRIMGLGDESRTSPRLPVETLRESATIRLAATAVPVSELFRVTNQVVELTDAQLVDRLEGDHPVAWPVTTPPPVRTYSLRTIPVDSAVIIAATLDLTETELQVAPEVRTLYIIAEKIVCGTNARITWRRPGGTTPGRADDPDLDGRGWSGVHTKPDSRDGLDGEDGRGGAPGIAGAGGRHAPALEIWVKDMTAMPHLDLNGEDGRVGGAGQRGGRGGNGADGHVGKRAWFFGWHCTTDPGDGGHGGNGGPGGRGGRGGAGGNGGKISIGVLEGTLEATVTSRAFRIKDQGGAPGRGGPGGAGGLGGRGGRSGAGETCTDADNGWQGAQGQPGAVGPDGPHPGVDGEIEFLEFTEEAWDDLLTRPWLTELSPTSAFPGDRLTLRGSRFSSNDRVLVGATALVPTINADESISVTVPLGVTGGDKVVFVRRPDGTESNRLTLRIRPQLDVLPASLTPAASVTLTGRAFLAGASALVNGGSIPATSLTATTLTFTMPGTGGGGSPGSSVTVEVRNPDGLVSNSRTGQLPRILEIPFRYGVHNLTFPNFTDGLPDWGTYEDTFGTAEVWHELLDPVFGHPVLTAAFYGFYHHFLKGKANGGLATGFCTSLASLVADRFWQGVAGTTAITKADVQKMLTAVHGKLLSRESLLRFHDQGREGVARVERTYREIEATVLRGTGRENAPLLFFIPAGEVWDAGYVDKLSDSHCVMPYRFVYPLGRPAPQLSADGSSTLTDPDQVQLMVWDCNKPTSPNCRLVFRRSNGQIHFDYFADSATPKFSSTDGITLGMMTNGDYMLADHDLPFTGPLGLTRFVIDFLLSPADLQVTDAVGLRTGNFGGQILAEIPDSHPCYLLPGAYLLPEETALTRRIVGTGAGTYTYTSLLPTGASLVLENVATGPGQVDGLAVSADATQIRFTPATDKTFSITLARLVGDQVRALAISGMAGGPAAEVDVTTSPELSLLRMGNRGASRTVEVRAFTIDRASNTPTTRRFTGVTLPSGHDLTVAVPNWGALNPSVQAVAFQ
jgi:hypothetical protein